MTEKKNPFFTGLRDALEEGLQALREKRPLTQREVLVPDPPTEMTPREIAHLREEKLGVSQAANKYRE